ncbi:hypothetical protein ACJ41O_013333 [Fusarium nematophilum]
MEYNSTACGDGLFGPSVWTEGCRGGFDFTLSFQESILSITPAALFLLLTGPRAAYLLKKPDKAKRHATYTPKLIAAAVYAALQVTLVALVPSSKHINTRFSLSSAILSLLAAFSIVLLAHIEHVKSIRPSFLLTAYLFVSLLFDAARLRTEWLLSLNLSYAAVLSTSTAFKLALLVLETVEKRRILISPGDSPSKESTSGPFTTRREKPSLFLTTIRILKWELLSITPPRLAMIALSISQPFLVNQALRFLTMPASEAAMNLGYGLIGAFAFVFMGSAIITAWYEHLTFRAGAMVRGGLITLIYGKMMKLPTDDLSESSAVALMGNDVETLVEKLHMLLVESWANTITVGIAMWMLAAQLGAVCVAPIVTAIISLILSGSIGKMMVPRQTVYQKATQDRINFTSEVLGSMKPVKMLGLSERFGSLISQKRDEEIHVGKRYRMVSVYANCITNCNISLTEAITFGAYAIAAKLGGGEPFSAAQAITALSILGVMMDPLSQLLGNIPNSFSAFGCFKRIQEFLMLDERVDRRDIYGGHGSSSKSPQESEGALPDAVDLTTRQQVGIDGSHISIADGNFNWGEKAVLSGINTSFSHHENGSLTMVVGPVGSGKSSLLKAILGETSSSNGRVSLRSSEVAFCEQTPWVMNASIRDNVVAESRGFDSAWFDTVVSACDLKIDIARFPEGDQTMVGDKGVKLSGGQKQRLAIARAVYSRKGVAIFDDVFSGLDKVTEQTVFSRVFGTDGLLRKNGTTIILSTHAVHRLPESDFVIALDKDGRVVEQGTFPDLRSRGGYVKSLDISSHFKEQEEEKTSSESSAAEEKGSSGVQQSDENTDLPSDRSVFMYYFGAIRAHNMALQVSFIVTQGVIATFRYVWITWWGDGKGRDSTDIGYWLSIYGVLSLLEGVLITMAIAAPMSFLNNSEAGSLVNRFSQDLRLVDTVLPLSLSVFLFEVAACFGAAGLAIAAVGWFAVSIPFVIAVLVLIQRFYVRTSKQLRLLEIEHKAPLFSHFLESINGLATIRAFGWTQPYNDKVLLRLDSAQKPSYLLNCIQRWLTLVLDMVVACLTVVLVVFAVTLRDRINSSLLGIALVNMMRLGSNMKGIILYWSILETSLGAITRIRAFSSGTPSEQQPGENRQPRQEWPSEGSLEVKDLDVQYDQTAEPIIRSISLSIKHGDKLGICGRSGSGKSSFVQALLRMAEITNGRITLDGEDISLIPRSLIRQRLSCLTQDPFLFSDTIRFNADPLNKYADDEIRRALDRVGIWSVIQSKAGETDPLDEKMDENFLSHGQRQLFCLARALLKKSSLLILDEPTSSVDTQTDARIQEVIRSEFTDCSVIMIAHRIDTLLDFDKVAVLDRGTLVEFGAPRELLADAQKCIYNMTLDNKVIEEEEGPGLVCGDCSRAAQQDEKDKDKDRDKDRESEEENEEENENRAKRAKTK